MKQQGRISINIQTGSADLYRRAAEGSAAPDQRLFHRQEEASEQEVQLCGELFLDPLQLNSKFILNLIPTIRDTQNAALVHPRICQVLLMCTQCHIRNLAITQPAQLGFY